MPDYLMAFVGLRSTWARHHISMSGLTVIDAGFCGSIVLEINRGMYGFDGNLLPDLPVPYGERFAHIIFARTSNPCVPYAGKYQGQRGITPAI
jgi:dCTP deaminase